jgi:hypothetical protein
MQNSTRHRIHDPHDERNENSCDQHDHRRLLQLRPRRPGYFFQQLLIRLPEIGRDFVHDFLLFSAGYHPALRTGTRIRTQTEGFGDLCTTVILCPYHPCLCLSALNAVTGVKAKSYSETSEQLLVSQRYKKSADFI